MMMVCYQHHTHTHTLTATHLWRHLTYRAVRGIHESYSIKPVFYEPEFQAFWFPGNRSLSLAFNVNALGLAINLESLTSYLPILFLCLWFWLGRTSDLPAWCVGSVIHALILSCGEMANIFGRFSYVVMGCVLAVLLPMQEQSLALELYLIYSRCRNHGLCQVHNLWTAILPIIFISCTRWTKDIVKLPIAIKIC